MLKAEQYEEERRVGKENMGGFWKRYHKLHNGVAELIEQYAKVTYVPLDIEDKRSMAFVVGLADRANGFVYSPAYLMNGVEKQIDY